MKRHYLGGLLEITLFHNVFVQIVFVLPANFMF